MDEVRLHQERADLISERLATDFDRRDGAIYESEAILAQKKAREVAAWEYVADLLAADKWSTL